MSIYSDIIFTADYIFVLVYFWILNLGSLEINVDHLLFLFIALIFNLNPSWFNLYTEIIGLLKKLSETRKNV